MAYFWWLAARPVLSAIALTTVVTVLVACGAWWDLTHARQPARGTTRR